MRIGVLTDSLSAMPFGEMLDAVAALGVHDLEFATGGWSEAPHLDVHAVLDDAAARDRFLGALRERDLTISALNINGNQLHPVIGERVDETVRATVRLAGLLGVETVVLMSGLPGGAPGDSTPNWITTSWPPETRQILDYQWNEVALPYWRDLAGFGSRHGVRFAVEMHGSQLVYNAATLLRLRESVGETLDDAARTDAAVRRAATRRFEFLDGLETDELRALIEKQRPQTVALIARYAAPECRARVLGLLRFRLREEVEKRMRSPDEPDQKVVAAVEASLREALGAVGKTNA